ncbi:MerR family transcriptional regulator [Fulvimarina sp. 2208YS6-2-32]|uniref:MerR family transcriptional regulator n=1 Tax=Fulvimarina uroteuthidis TaxID=3098149 RepID=A0ABU5I3J3_9HYPH|nr:MerR family transcriptional regulator [Fulvimarina sp. 2208YS6-2-32]MDY8109533.1 MerR family transcriptional regulator [Fulvimarina sp. 2208YS6-2-32]
MRKIGEVAAMFQTTPRTLLYYEELGILSPQKTEKGTRMYSEVDIRRFSVAYELSHLGIPFRTIRALAALCDHAPDKVDIAERKMSTLASLAEDLRAQIERIERVATDVESAIGVIASAASTSAGSTDADFQDALFRSSSARELPAILSLLVPREGPVRSCDKAAKETRLETSDGAAD